jgi:hypothetical protein
MKPHLHAALCLAGGAAVGLLVGVAEMWVRLSAEDSAARVLVALALDVLSP